MYVMLKNKAYLLKEWARAWGKTGKNSNIWICFICKWGLVKWMTETLKHKHD